MGMDLPLQAVQRQIISGIDILVHLGRLRDKSRRVLDVAEITGIENGEISLQPLFTYQEDKGLVRAGSLRDQKKLERAGIVL